MENLTRLWLDGGFVMWALLFAFAGGLFMHGVQLILTRRIRLPGLLLGWATTLVGLALAGHAIGLVLSLDIVAKAAVQNPGLISKGQEIAAIPLLFALWMVIVLVVLQFLASMLASKDALPVTWMPRGGRLVGGLAALAVLIGGALSLRAVMTLDRLIAVSAGVPAGDAPAIAGLLRMAVGFALAGAVLGLIRVAISILQGFRGARSSASS